MAENEAINGIYQILAEAKLRKSEEDMYIQYPSAIEEMQVPANKEINTLNRRINKRLKTITVSIPEDGMMEVWNNNVRRMWFSNESGTLEFKNGLYMEDMEIWLYNASSEPKRFNYRLIFAQ